MFDVISIGSATLDVFLHSKDLKLKKRENIKEICVAYGAKLEVEEILFETGGGGTNSAVTFARQNLKTAVIAKVGNDFTASKIIRQLKKEKINTHFILRDKRDITDYSSIFWTPDGGRTILIYRGKTKLEGKNILWKKIKSKWFYISSIEGNLDLVSNIYGFTHDDIKIAWNPGERELAQKDKVLKILPHIELLILNKEEIKELLAIKETSKKTIKKILKSAQNIDCHLILITDGQYGSYFWNGKNWFYSGVYKTIKKENTGAGDAYGSGFVAGIIKNYSFLDSLKLAAANAASVVSYPGAKKGILKSKQANKYLKKPLKIIKIE